MTVIGLTGGIASGKSTVSSYLRQKGIPIFDADACARDVEKKGEPCLAALVRAFGTEILTPEGELDRAKMADVAFHDKKALATLNAIVHKAIEEKRDAFLQAHEGEPLVIVDAPLLLECGWEKLVDQVWVVSISEEEQIRRAMARSGMSRQEVVDRIHRQMPLAEKTKQADVVIDNSGGLEQLYKQVDALLDVRRETCV